LWCLAVKLVRLCLFWFLALQISCSQKSTRKSTFCYGKLLQVNVLHVFEIMENRCIFIISISMKIDIRFQSPCLTQQTHLCTVTSFSSSFKIKITTCTISINKESLLISINKESLVELWSLSFWSFTFSSCYRKFWRRLKPYWRTKSGSDLVIGMPKK